MALVDPYVPEAPRKITDEEREFKAYRTLRDSRAVARHEGKRKARQQKVRLSFLVCATRLIFIYIERGRGGQQEEVDPLWDFLRLPTYMPHVFLLQNMAIPSHFVIIRLRIRFECLDLPLLHLVPATACLIAQASANSKKSKPKATCLKSSS